MAFFDRKVKIDGVPCAMVSRGTRNGEYALRFQRPEASLEQIEGIHWKRPVVSGPSGLPAGYGFEVKRIDYSMCTKTYTVTVRVLEQYLGDVAGYQARVDELEQDNAALARDKAALEGQLAEADETAIALFEELEAVQAGKETEA